jgi:hypothetical protein
MARQRGCSSAQTHTRAHWQGMAGFGTPLGVTPMGRSGRPEWPLGGCVCACTAQARTNGRRPNCKHCSACAGLWLVNIEERAHVGRGVGGAAGSAVSNGQDDDDDERAREGGGKHHDQRDMCCVITCDARRHGEPRCIGPACGTACVLACVRARVGVADAFGLSTRRRNAGFSTTRGAARVPY